MEKFKQGKNVFFFLKLGPQIFTDTT